MCARTATHLPHPYARKLEVGKRCLLRLLDEAVQQNHFICDYREKHTGDSLRQADPNLPQIRLYLANQRHPKRPSRFYRLDVIPDRLSVLRIQAAQPFAHGLVALTRLIETDKQDSFD